MARRSWIGVYVTDNTQYVQRWPSWTTTLMLNCFVVRHDGAC